jgi:hypothetical protein
VDPTGAAVPEAEVEAINVETNVKHTRQSDASGYYILQLLEPGMYRLTVTKAGFKPTVVPSIRLDVNQSLTQDVTLSIGSVTQRMEVKAEADLVQTASSEIGTVVGQKATNELPLNGRNFSQLLTMVPGVTPVTTSQAASNLNDMLAMPTTAFSLPPLAGQWTRSTLTYADGLLDTDLGSTVYVVSPIVDSIQEFKVQMHNDKAEYGGVLGGVISVITKGGTNSLHGSGYEFVRNNWFDARNPFADEFRSGPSPFRQNQFGGTVGGPIMIPRLYNGRNRTFFYFGYEGWRYTQAAQSRYYVPTDEELGGDFSHSLINQNIFDPSTTQADPNKAGEYLRTQFAASSDPSSPNYNAACTNAAGCPNMIPASRIDQKVVSFIKTYFDRPNLVGDPVHNDLVTLPNLNNADTFNGRIDEQLGNKDSIFFRWSRMDYMRNSPTSTLGSTGTKFTCDNVGGGWNHTVSPMLILEARGGVSRRGVNDYDNNSAGLTTMLGLGMTSPDGSTIALASPWGSAGIDSPYAQGRNLFPFASGNLIWVHGRHNAKFGVQYISNGVILNTASAGTYTFTNDTTNNPELTGTTGASLASALLGLPSQTNITSASALNTSYAIWGPYAQDEWRLRNNVTVTYGLRLDLRRPFSPGNSSTFVGGPDAETGDYLIGLDKMPPVCGNGVVAPCLPAPLSQIPNGDHIMLSPNGRSWGPKQELDDWGPRVGVAWRLNQETVVRGGYGIVYDPLSGLMQDWRGIAGSWPAASGEWSMLTYNQLGQPLTSIEQTFGKIGVALPSADPWEQVNWFFDPNHKDARSQQWNLEVERQMTSNLALSIGYMGSHSDRLDQTGLWNTATTAGPGTTAQVQALRPFPWWPGSNFMGTSAGLANYHALEVKLERRLAQGFYYLLSYTWSKSMDTGTSGWFDAENGGGGGVQDYYHQGASYSVSGYDITHMLSMSGVYELPFGRGKKYFDQHGAASWLLGNWQTNAIVQLRSGQPYSMSVAGDVANVGNTISWWNYARPNLVGDPHVSHPTSDEWFNPSAFAVPSYSYGNLGRDTMRSAPVYTADFSLFKNFRVREGMNFQFRAEFFNIFNIQNYAVPDSLVGDPAEGFVTSTVNPSRQIQLALRLTF